MVVPFLSDRTVQSLRALSARGRPGICETQRQLLNASGRRHGDYLPIEVVDCNVWVASGGNEPQAGAIAPTRSIGQKEPRRISYPYDSKAQEGDRVLSYSFERTADWIVTVNATTDVFTCAGHTFVNEQPIQFANENGALPGGIAERTSYYIRDVSGNTFKVAATRTGTAINITGAGTGTHYIALGSTLSAVDVNRDATRNVSLVIYAQLISGPGEAVSV